MTWFALPLLLVTATPPAPEPADAQWVYIGTYTNAQSRGIYRVEFDAKSGRLGMPEVAAELKNPSFLAIHPRRGFLYAVNEVSQVGGKPVGSVSGFVVDAKSGDLTPINRQSSGGPGPCHLTVDSEGKAVLVANYGGGSVESLPIGDDGKLGESATFIQHAGSSVDPGRQGEPHAHSINLDVTGRFAVAADLGLDKVFVYRFDPTKATLAPNTPPFATVAAGSGPRHFAFHPSNKYGYVINELKSTVTAFRFDADLGTLNELQTISTLPADDKGKSYTAAEHRVRMRTTNGLERLNKEIKRRTRVATLFPQHRQLPAPGHRHPGRTR